MAGSELPGLRRVSECVWTVTGQGAALVIESGQEFAHLGLVEAWGSSTGVAFETSGGHLDESAFLAVLAGLEARGARDRVHEIPVCYALGPDLDEVSALAGLSIDEVLGLHGGSEYRCLSLGFAPGFAYLGPLPDPIASVPRRVSPRPSVGAGAVAIAAGHTAVYPGGTAGGWWLIGMTPLTVCDWRNGYFPIEVGDRVTFVPVSEDEFASRSGERL